jgi:nitrite reductase/ring-hydroxylating ferredoxin subunit/uncharacterized membrane protein
MENLARIDRFADRAMEGIGRQAGLDGLAERLDRALHAAFDAMGEAGHAVRNLLHGTWLGHPLHPALVHLPIGAWTAAVALDAVDARRGADTAVAVGIAGAAAAALPGLADWQHTDPASRRVGLVHAMLNTAALGIFGASLAMRRAGARDAGRALALAGLGAVLVSGYLGGYLVYRRRVGVDQAERADGPRDFVPVLAATELREGDLRRVEVSGVRVLLARRGGAVHAIGEVCAHAGGPLAEGRLEDGGVTCPWHGSQFSLEDGAVVRGPATAPVPRFETRVLDGRIEIRRV